MMPVALDGRSVAIFAIFVGVIVAVSMAYMYGARKTFRGFGAWTAAAALYVPGQVLLVFQGIAPDWIAIVLANGLIILSYQLVLRGMWRFAEIEPPLWVDAAIVIFLAAALAFFSYVRPSLAIRVAAFSSVSVLQSVLGLDALFRLARRLESKTNACLVAGFASVIAIAAARTALALALDPLGTAYMLASSTQAASLMSYSGAYLFLFLGLQTQNAMRVEDELRRAAEEVKTLSGIIPICSHCKKVRNDSGYWEQVEAYVSSRTDAGFSHGICPECLEKHYPEQAERLRRRSRGT